MVSENDNDLPTASAGVNVAAHADTTRSGDICGTPTGDPTMINVSGSAAPSVQLSSQSGDDKWSQRADAGKRESISHQNGNNRPTRHRASRAGTRCISKLSAAQLARKRATDREAQRAIRQRTKEHIENLERRIQELSAIQLQNLHLEDEIRVLKQRMTMMQMENAAINTSTGLGMSTGMRENMGSGIRSMQWPMDMYNASNRLTGFGRQPMAMSRDNTPMSATDITAPYLASNRPLSPYPKTESPGPGSFVDLDARGFDFASQIARSADELSLASELASERSWNSQSPFDLGDSKMFTPPPISYVQSNTMPFTFTAPPLASQPAPTSALSNLPYSISPQSQTQQQHQQQQQPLPPLPLQPQSQQNPLQSQPGRFQHASSTLPVWAQIPQFIPPTSSASSLLQSALHTHRNSILSGVPYPTSPDYTSLLSLPSARPDTLSAAIIHAIRVAGFKSLAVQAGILYTTHALLRWQTNPLPETYGHIPPWLRPGRRQLQVPHTFWVGQLIWGGLRERLVDDPGRYVTREFIVYYSRNLEIDWEGGEDVGVDGREGEGIFVVNPGGELALTRRFEETVRELGSWRMRREFVARYPELGEVVRSEDG